MSNATINCDRKPDMTAVCEYLATATVVRISGDVTLLLPQGVPDNVAEQARKWAAELSRENTSNG